MTNNRPHAILLQTRRIKLMLIQLRIRQRLQHKPSTKQAHRQTMNSSVPLTGRMPRLRRQGAERDGERERNDGLEQRSWQELREECLAPEVLLVLDLGVAGVVFAAGKRARKDPAEGAAAPEGHAGDEDLLVPAESGPGFEEGDVCGQGLG